MNSAESISVDSEKLKSNKLKRIMIAGIGNMFLQDDGFGVEVIKRIRQSNSRSNVEIKDGGVGGLKLAYDLMQGYDLLILVDVSSRNEAPGTLYVIEPEEDKVPSELNEGSFIDPHGSDVTTVLKFVRAINAWPGKLLIVGCEPASVDDFEMGLSAPVAAAVEDAVVLIEGIIQDFEKN